MHCVPCKPWRSLRFPSQLVNAKSDPIAGQVPVRKAHQVLKMAKTDPH